MHRVALTDTYATKPDDPGPAPGLDPSQGAVAVPDRPTFEALARRDDVPGALAAREMKILIIGVDTPAPALYFLNTNTFPFHYDFADQALHIGIGLAEFNARTYFRDDRSNLAGTIVAQPSARTSPSASRSRSPAPRAARSASGWTNCSAWSSS